MYFFLVIPFLKKGTSVIILNITKFLFQDVIFDEQHFPFRTNQYGTPQEASASPNFSTRLSLLLMVSSQQPLPPNPSLSTKNPASPADLPTSPSVPPSSLAGTPQVVVDSPPLIIYSRRSKLQSGASPAAADLPTFEYPSSCANQQSNRDPCAAAHVTPVLPPPPVHPMVTRSRAKQISLNHLALLTDSSFPSELRTYNQAKSNPNWIDAMQKEYVALLANHTCSFHIRTKCDRL
jgi:hypothetical protein